MSQCRNPMFFDINDIDVSVSLSSVYHIVTLSFTYYIHLLFLAKMIKVTNFMWLFWKKIKLLDWVWKRNGLN